MFACAAAIFPSALTMAFLRFCSVYIMPERSITHQSGRMAYDTAKVTLVESR